MLAKGKYIIRRQPYIISRKRYIIVRHGERAYFFQGTREKAPVVMLGSRLSGQDQAQRQQDHDGFLLFGFHLMFVLCC